MTIFLAIFICHKKLSWLLIFALGGMDAAVSKFYCSFYKVKTTRYKNGTEAIFISGECVRPQKLLLFVVFNSFLCQNYF